MYYIFDYLESFGRMLLGLLGAVTRLANRGFRAEHL